jgi:hypothetical protein
VNAWSGLEDRVRSYARANGIGPTELARRLGYEGKSRSWGSRFMSGHKGLPADRLEAVAALMDTTIAGLFLEEAAAVGAGTTPPALPAFGLQMAWEFRRAASLTRRSTMQAQLRDIAWSLEQVSTQGTPGAGAEQAPAKRRRARA